VCNPVTRHVTVVANQMATLNREFPGRVGLGIGAGAAPLKTIGAPIAKLGELERFVVACRALMHGEDAEVSATSGPIRFLQFWRDALDAETRVPIRIAAGGPKSLRLAGAIADEVITGTIDPALLRIQIEHVRAGARAAGRSESDVGVSVVAAVHIGDADVETLAQRMGGYVVNMLASNGAAAAGREDELHPDLVAAFGRVKEAEQHVVARAVAASGGRRSAAFESYMEALPDEYRPLLNDATLRAKALFGEPEEVRRRLDELASLGVTRVVVYPDPKDETALTAFADHYISRGDA
jgi:alkanesulfonate monooxygenase SsuD/methylene tetrahydromethanopterin reductase-like flavin-dependent oxidoreductase (luciferase family)